MSGPTAALPEAVYLIWTYLTRITVTLIGQQRVAISLEMRKSLGNREVSRIPLDLSLSLPLGQKNQLNICGFGKSRVGPRNKNTYDVALPDSHCETK